MNNPIYAVLRARALAMAEQDGTLMGAVHLHGAANLLQAELISARDQLMQEPRAPTVTLAAPIAPPAPVPPKPAAEPPIAPEPKVEPAADDHSGDPEIDGDPEIETEPDAKQLRGKPEPKP